MYKKIILGWMTLFCCLNGCASTGQVEKQADHPAVMETEVSNPEQESMMIPANARKTPNGYAYITLEPGDGTKPSLKSAVDIQIRVLNIEGGVVDEGSGTIAMAHSTPLFEEMLPLMSIGEKVRVWGESDSRIWEIKLVSVDKMYSAPEDVAEVPANARLLTGFEDIYWRIIENGTGPVISENQVLRIQGTRWKSDGEILESNRAGRGMMLLMNEAQKQADPIHHALFLQMNLGMHVRIWIPAKYENTPYDVVEDFWLMERLEQLETPKDCTQPESMDDVITIDDKVFMKWIDKKSAESLKTGDEAEVDITCWNQETGQLIDAGYMREKHDIMDIKPELGIWEKIMTHAGHGDVFMTWIDKTQLPESVQMSLTCRVVIF